MKKSTIPFLTISLLISVAGILLWALKIGFVFEGTAAVTVDLAQMWLCMLVAVIFSLLYGFVRFDRVHAVALAFSVLHDLLLTFALTVVVSMALPGMTKVPVANTLTAAVLLSVAFAYTQTMLVLREARQVVRTTSRRDVTYENAADLAVSNSRKLRILVAAMAFVMVLAIAIAGGEGLVSAFVPVFISILVSFYSAEKLNAYVWAYSAVALKGRRGNK